MNREKLSVITINLNNFDGLKRTIGSVISQSFRDYEFLVIDGGSTDGSRDIINQYTDKITWSISEPDAGIYNAMNKGIRRAKGEYCLFLNSGDWLANDIVLQRVFSGPQEADVISGDIAFYDTAKQSVKWFVPSPEELTANTLFNGTLPHQASFIKRKLFDRYGLYNENLKIASDWLFFVETLLEHNVTYKHYNGLVAYFNMDGISCNPETNGLPRKEQLQILQQKYPRFIVDYNRLKQLDEEARLWKESRDYRVYRSLEKSGVIKLGVLVVRGINFLKRKLKKVNSEERIVNSEELTVNSE
jgi:glycosyltransferase involved in cell wall biosynthesis